VSSRRTGFTLIELLVVVAVMATLAGMVIALIGPIRLRAKLTATTVKMQSVLDGISGKGQQEGSAVYSLQVETLPWTPDPMKGEVATDPEPGLRGVRTFIIDSATQLPIPGANPPGPLPKQQLNDWGVPIVPQPPYTRLLYPWGKPSGLIDPMTMKPYPPQALRLRDISPANTRKLLYAASVIPLDKTKSPAFKEYLTDRGENQAWNDRWGHPLVVGSILYQPTSSQEVVDALKRYQYNRSVYVAVAAVGPSARITPVKMSSDNESDWSGANGVLQSIWNQANRVCQQAKVVEGDGDWTEKSFDSRAWQGIKIGHKDKLRHEQDKNRTASAALVDPDYAGADEHCLLSMPMEIK
jgi:prepilin-type N-terminal cleavage/methylation domain-containing protein